MTNRMFANILNLHNNKISDEVCIASIIELCHGDSMLAARFIVKFLDIRIKEDLEVLNNTNNI